MTVPQHYDNTSGIVSKNEGAGSNDGWSFVDNEDNGVLRAAGGEYYTTWDDGTEECAELEDSEVDEETPGTGEFERGESDGETAKREVGAGHESKLHWTSAEGLALVQHTSGNEAGESDADDTAGGTTSRVTGGGEHEQETIGPARQGAIVQARDPEEAGGGGDGQPLPGQRAMDDSGDVAFKVV